jgi:hypothetical protein
MPARPIPLELLDFWSPWSGMTLNAPVRGIDGSWATI